MIVVKTPGLFTTVQDEGRFGYSSKGVPTSGAMDLESYRLANYLLNNDFGTPVLEFTQIGPTLYFYARSVVVITGGKYEVKLNGNGVPSSKPFIVDAGSELKIGKLLSGNYGYLAVEGGFYAQEVLGSSSYCPNVNEAGKCKKGTTFVFVRSTLEHLDKNAKVVSEIHNRDTHLHVERGPEFHLLLEEDQRSLSEVDFKIGTNSSRMAIQLDHELEISATDILTAPVQPGTIQLTPAGNLIVLMRDAQTTGGYARILQLSVESINKLAQTGIGKTIQFVLS
jgi:biotin-dependent carboxylase-like uncharacterized protein